MGDSEITAINLPDKSDQVLAPEGGDSELKPTTEEISAPKKKSKSQRKRESKAKRAATSEKEKEAVRDNGATEAVVAPDVQEAASCTQKKSKKKKSKKRKSTVGGASELIIDNDTKVTGFSAPPCDAVKAGEDVSAAEATQKASGGKQKKNKNKKSTATEATKDEKAKKEKDALVISASSPTKSTVPTPNWPRAQVPSSTGATPTKFIPKGEYDKYASPQKAWEPKPRSLFADYISPEEAAAGVVAKTMLRGGIRINPRNYKECFMDHPLGTSQPDVIILENHRNRAMNGDIVISRIRPRAEWLILESEFEAWSKTSKESLTNDDGKQCEGQENESEGKEIDFLENMLTSVSVTPKGKRSNFRRTLSQAIRNLDTTKIVPDSCLQMTAEVVLIDTKKHNRLAAGKLQLMPKSQYNVLFVASDSRVPRMLIPRAEVDPEFFNRPEDFAKFVYTAKLVDWRSNSIYADGCLLKQIGEKGSIDTEMQTVLFVNDVITDEFDEEALGCLNIPSEDAWTIPEKEFTYRRDLRDEIIFTIDPKTARDLDDALSIRPIDDCDGKGTPGWEVGVHIADVTFFIEDQCALDCAAQKRANSTYLTNMVVPMLPRILCEQLCSLNPGVDRLTFSVVWKMTDRAEVVDTWFGRSVIRSRVKLAYEHAQDFIDHPEKEFDEAEIPTISDGVRLSEIKEKVLQLHRMAQVLRQGRETGGALRIEMPKLKFSCDPVTKQPIGVSVYQIKPSNKLVEEFMLLANMSVAEFIAKSFPKHAMLRRHPPPKEKMIAQVVEMCAKIGFPLDGTSSRQLSSSFKRYQADTLLNTCIRQVLSTLTIKPMEMAVYFCIASVDGPSGYRHYALNVDFYTHFTSPIRRYPDMVVHRQLAAALGYSAASTRTSDELEEIAVHCNERKLASKTASEAADDFFFGLFIHNVGRIKSRAVVVQVLDSAVSVLVVQYGVVVRVYCEMINLLNKVYNEFDMSLTLLWNKDEDADSVNGIPETFIQRLQMCSVVDVELLPKADEPGVYWARLLRPTQRQQAGGFKPLTDMDDDDDLRADDELLELQTAADGDVDVVEDSEKVEQVEALEVDL